MNAPDSDVILSTDMDFKISNEPFYYIVTLNNIEDDEDGVTHRYEHILKITKRSADCQYTMNDYIMITDKYTEATDKVIGKSWDGISPSDNPVFIPITKHFEPGDDIVTRYATYGSEFTETLKYRMGGVVYEVTKRRYVSELFIKYEKYDHTVYDDDGTVIHAKGDVKIDESGNMIWDYVPVDKQFHWQLVNTVEDTISKNIIEEPLD
jgi:hypothetical protein